MFKIEDDFISISTKLAKYSTYLSKVKKNDNIIYIDPIYRDFLIDLNELEIKKYPIEIQRGLFNQLQIDDELIEGYLQFYMITS